MVELEISPSFFPVVPVITSVFNFDKTVMGIIDFLLLYCTSQ